MPSKAALTKIAERGYTAMVENIEAIQRHLNELTTAAASENYQGARAAANSVATRAATLQEQLHRATARAAARDKRLGELIGVGTHPQAEPVEEQLGTYKGFAHRGWDAVDGGAGREPKVCDVCGKLENITQDAHGNRFTDFLKHSPRHMDCTLTDEPTMREVAQWWSAGGFADGQIITRLPDAIRRRCYQYGQLVSWQLLPEEAKQAAARRLVEIRAQFPNDDPATL